MSVVIETMDSHVSLNHRVTLERGIYSCSKLERKYLYTWKAI